MESKDPTSLKETTGWEFRVYGACMRYFARLKDSQVTTADDVNPAFP